MIRRYTRFLKVLPRLLWYARRRTAVLLSRGRDLALAIAILRQRPAVGGSPAAARQQIQRVTWTFSGLAVIAIGPPGRPASAMIKIPHMRSGIASLRRQRQVQTALLADARVGDWRTLVPQPLGQGAIAGRFYLVERAFRGQALAFGRADRAAIERHQRNAASIIGQLHRRTAAPLAIDEAVLYRWIDVPLRIIRDVNATLPHVSRSDDAIEQLRAELVGAFLGRTFQVGWIHGDFWLGNILFDRHGVEIVGLVDWDRAAPRELPMHDILHLVFHTRAIQQASDPGDIVREFLRGDGWTDHERSLFNEAEARLLEDASLRRAMVLQYWLRNRAATLTLLPEQCRDNVWVAQNIVGVLQSL